MLNLAAFRQHKTIKRLLVFGILWGAFFPGTNATDIPIYRGDNVIQFQQETLILNADDTSGDMKLQFGKTLDKSLLWDDANAYFVFNDDVSLSGNELKNFRVENVSSAPTCDTAAKGRIYHNTTNTNSYVCNGSTWNQIDAAGGSSSSILGQFIHGTGGTDVNTATPTAISWNTETRKDSGITHSNTVNSSRITLDQAGWYEIKYFISHENQTNNRATPRCRIRLNGSTYLTHSTSYSYTRNTTDAEGTNSASVLIQTTGANEYYEVLCDAQGSSGSELTLAGATWTVVEKK